MTFSIWICPFAQPNASVSIDQVITLCGRTGNFWAFPSTQRHSYNKLAIGDIVLFVSQRKFRFVAMVSDKFRISPEENVYNGDYSLGFQFEKLVTVDIVYSRIRNALGYGKYMAWQKPVCLKRGQRDIITALFLREEHIDITAIRIAARNERVNNLVGSQHGPEWQVDRISASRIVHGMTQYKVHWLPTWEPEENLMNAQSIIRDYERNL